MALLHMEGFGLFKRGEVPNAALAAVQGYEYAYRTVADPVVPTRNAVALSPSADPIATNLRMNSSWFQDVSYGNGLYVAITLTGDVICSPDLSTWSMIKNLATRLNSIIFANGKFTTVGAGGYIASSTNGVDWTPAASGIPATDELNRIVYGEGRYVACGTSGLVLTSLDGMVWASTVAVSSAYTWHDVVYDDTDKRFVIAGGTTSAASGTVYYSTDGASWTSTSVSPAGGGYIASIIKTPMGAMAHTAAGHIYTRASLVSGSWVQRATGMGTTQGGKRSRWYFINNLAVLAPNDGSTFLAVSSDGVTFTKTTNTGVSGLSSLLVVGGRTLGFGNGVSISESYDILNWSVIRTGSTGTTYINPIYANGRWLLSCGSYSFTSPDGTTWTAQGRSVNQSNSTVSPTKMVFALDYFWAVAGNAGTVWRSRDGVTWESIAMGVTTAALNDIVYANGVFVVVGDRVGVYTSPDGLTWTTKSYTSSATTAASSLRYIAEDGTGRFLVTPAAGYICYQSIDGGDTFGPINIGAVVTTAIQALAADDGVFVVGGANGTIAYASNPAGPWTARETPVTGYIYSIAGESGIWYLGGQNGHLATSHDLDSWFLVWSASSYPVANRLVVSGLALRNGKVLAAIGVSDVVTTWGPARLAKTIGGAPKKLVTGFSIYVPNTYTASATPRDRIARVSMAGMGVVEVRSDLTVATALNEVAPSTVKLAVGTINYVEVMADPDANQLRAWVNDVLVLDTTCTTVMTLTDLRVQGSNILYGEMFVAGHWYILDGTGTRLNSRLGSATRITTQNPDADVQAEFERPAGAASNASVVGSQLGAATPRAVFGDTVGQTDLYTSTADIPADVAKVHAVMVQSVGKAMLSAPHTMSAVIRSAGEEAVADSVVMAVPDRYVAGSAVFFTDPGTGADWTPDAVKQAAFGVRIKS